MAESTAVTIASEAVYERIVHANKGPLRAVLAFAREYPLGAIGGILTIFFALLAVFGPLFVPYDPVETSRSVLQSPSSEYWFGTDNLGRDLFSRVVQGARTSMTVGLLSVLISTVAGAFIGLCSGFFGGWVDAVVMRIVDMAMAFPSLVLALAIMAMLGPSMQNVILAIGLTQIPAISRVVRSQTLSVKSLQFIESARALGCADSRLLRQHVLPNVLPIIIIYGTTNLGYAILTEGTLSFLGAGVPPPAPSWGGMVSVQARQYMSTAPWMAVFPIAAVSLAIAGAALLGDSLRDALDPRLRSR